MYLAMKLLSWNVRGLGGVEKRREVSALVRERKPFILCIQETKLPVFDASVCKSIWGDDNVYYSYQPSVGASGGIATLWDLKEVEVWLTVSLDHVLAVSGRFLKSGDQFVVFNVYAPCDTSRQQVLWNVLSSRIDSLEGQNVCVCGDFNAIRREEERRSVSSVLPQAGIDSFNNFIVNNFLVDLPLRGRSFTWYRRDGRSMSRIDRFLLSENWSLTWPNCFQLTLSRGLSDHCPLELSIDTENWGPKPLRMLKCWADFPGYNSFVRDTWSSFQLSGWGSFVLKEKLKLLKVALRDWHHRHSKNLPARILSLKDKIASLDLKGESTVLSDDEIQELHGLSEDLFSLSRVNSSICWQQSRVQWLKEGDANSKFFHSVMSGKRSRNAIPFILANGTLVEGVENVRNAVFTHFRAQFQPTQTNRPNMDALDFRTLSFNDGASPYPSRTCVAGCDCVESSSHLFLHYNTFGSIWHLIYNWIGILVTNPLYVPDHFHQFGFSGGLGRKRRSILQVIWFATVWEIWKERNNRVFTSKESPVLQVVDRIKSISYMWMKAKHVTLPFNLHGWWLSPFTILGIG